jgi:anti-sigma B factor antagonist
MTRLQEGFVEDICVIKVEGRITLGDGSSAFRKYIQQRITDGQRNFIWDLSGVSLIDSSGLGELVSALTRVQLRTGKMVLITSRGIRDKLTITSLYTVFETAEDLTSAFKYFPGRTSQPEHDVKYEDKFAITIEKDKSGKKMVVTDNISDHPGRVEYNVRDIPPEETPKRLNPSSLIFVVLVGLGTLAVTIAGLVWAAKVISSVALLVLIFTLALLIFILLSAVVLLLSGHLSEKTASKLFGGVLGKLPGLGAFLPKTSGRKSD